MQYCRFKTEKMEVDEPVKEKVTENGTKNVIKAPSADEKDAKAKRAARFAS